MALQAGSIADLVASTLKELGELRFSQLTNGLQRYVVLSRLMQKGKVQFFSSGYGIQWDVMTSDNGSFKMVGLYATDNVNVPNTLTQGSTEWRHGTWNWGLDRREVAMNSSPRRIVDLIKTRRISSFYSACKGLEGLAWSCPPITDTTSPFGVPYWICKSATQGFYGTLPIGQSYTTVGGIVPTAYVNTGPGSGYKWANYTDLYTAKTSDDLVAKWEQAADLTYFEPPIESPDFSTGDEPMYACNYSVYSAMKALLKAQNDNLGLDIDPMDGKPTFRRVPISWVPALNQDTTDPVYGINWGEFHTAGLRQEWLHETQIPIQPYQHTVSATHTDISFNWLTRDRRRHFVLATATTTPTITAA